MRCRRITCPSDCTPRTDHALAIAQLQGNIVGPNDPLIQRIPNVYAPSGIDVLNILVRLLGHSVLHLPPDRRVGTGSGSGSGSGSPNCGLDFLR